MLGIPVATFDPAGLSERQSQLSESEICPVYLPSENYTADDFWEMAPMDRIHRREELFPRLRKPSAILLWSEDLGRVIETFDRTVMWCAQKKELVKHICLMHMMFYFTLFNRECTMVRQAFTS